MDELDILRRQLASSDPTVRKEAVWRTIDSAADEAMPLLIQALDDPAPSVRAMATFALRKAGVPEAVDALVRVLLSDSHDQVRCSAAFALLLTETPVPVDSLVSALKDSTESVRALVCHALGRHGDKTVSGPLMEMLSDASPDVREAACSALIALGIGDQRILETLNDLDEKQRQERVEKVRNFIVMVSSQPGLEHLWPTGLGDPVPRPLADLVEEARRLIEES